MSILITGMHKPKSCEECPFKDYEQGFCFASAGEDGNFLLCTSEVDKNEIHPNCPIIEIPKHGRLIDADTLQIAIDKYEMIHGLLKYDFTASAPTIIEGDKE